MNLLQPALLPFLVVVLVNCTNGFHPPPPVRPEGKCESSWYQYEDNCYKVHGDDPNDRTSWVEARDRCRSLGQGYDLASIHSMGEQMFLTSLIPYHQYNLWIGMYSETEGIDVFKWSDGTMINFTHWLPHLLRSYWAKKCAWLASDFYRAGRWNREFCDRVDNHGYICKTKSVSDRAIKHGREPSSNCKDKGFVEYNKACYKIFDGPKDWSSAEDSCSVEFRGHLASVNSPYEQAFLYNFIGGRTRQVWLGLRDNEGYGVYEWTDKWPVLYTAWDEVGPNYLPLGTTNCISFDTETKRWRANTNCSQGHSFICKTTKESAPVISYDKYNGVCPPHLIPRFDYGGRYCYHVGKHSWKSWGDASMYCTKQGGQLSSFTSPEQLSLLWPQLGSLDFQLWIGLIEKFNGQFEWIDGRRNVNFTNWYPTSNGDCAYMKTTDMKWRKDKCLGGFYFYQPLCMIEKDPR